MTNTPQIKPEWLEIIECCSAKVQIDLIRAIVAWQTDGTIPAFRGTKKAIFLIMVRDLDPTAAALIAAATAKREKPALSTEATNTTETTEPAEATEAAETAESAVAQPDPAPESTPAPKPAATRKRKDPRRNFFPYSPLY